MFQVTPPRLSSPLAGRTVTDYIRHPSMLTHLKAKSELDLNAVMQAILESIPVRSNDDMLYNASTEPVNEHGKLLVKVPRNGGYDLGKISLEIKEQKARIQMLTNETKEARIEAKEATAKMKKMAMTSKRAQIFRFKMFKSNLLTEFVKKLDSVAKKSTLNKTIQAGNDAGHQGSKWAQLASSFREADIKKITKDFEISQKSNSVMKVLERYSEYTAERNFAAHETKFQMAELLMSLSDNKANNYYFGGARFHYVYDKTVEEIVKQVVEDEAEAERDLV